MADQNPPVQPQAAPNVDPAAGLPELNVSDHTRSVLDPIGVLWGPPDGSAMATDVQALLQPGSKLDQQGKLSFAPTTEVLDSLFTLIPLAEQEPARKVFILRPLQGLLTTDPRYFNSGMFEFLMDKIAPARDPNNPNDRPAYVTVVADDANAYGPFHLPGSNMIVVYKRFLFNGDLLEHVLPVRHGMVALIFYALNTAAARIIEEEGIEALAESNPELAANNFRAALVEFLMGSCGVNFPNRRGLDEILKRPDDVPVEPLGSGGTF